MFGWKQTRAALRDLRKDRRGVAAIEFAFIAGFLSLAVLNVSDTGTVRVACSARQPSRRYELIGAAASFGFGFSSLPHGL
jgi:Flp pilus assembly pilin Flp